MQTAAFFAQNSVSFILLGIAVVGSIVYAILRTRKMKADGDAFLAQHSDAARVYLTTGALALDGAVQVHTVNGAAPAFFAEGGKSGFYLAPGRSNCQISYTYSRQGVMSRTVTKSTGVVQKVLEVESQCSYVLTFDRDTTAFTFARYEG